MQGHVNSGESTMRTLLDQDVESLAVLGSYPSDDHMLNKAWFTGSSRLCLKRQGMPRCDNDSEDCDIHTQNTPPSSLVYN